MIRSVTVINHLGEPLKMELGRPELSGFLIKEITGLGPPKANINSTENSTDDGSVFNSARLDARNIVLTMVLYPTPTIEDTRQLSYKYFPIMLSLPEEWDYTTKGLARICKDGVDSICAGVRELEDHGYVVRERVRNANGQLGAIEYTILEQPRPPEPKREKPERENPVQANPVLGSPVLGKPEQENPDQLNIL